MPKLSFNQVDFAYKQNKKTYPALHNLNLQIQKGEFVCVIGPSGSGKSTLLNLAAGLLQPDQGQILLDGKPMPRPNVDRAVVFQQYSLFPWLTAQENVAFGLRQAHRGMSKKEALARAADYLAQVEMADAGYKYPSQLSGGMRQRVAIARAVALQADMMLLDEPFGALDTKKRQDLQDLLEKLWENGGKQQTVLFITHDIEEAALLGNRIIFLDKGRIRKDIPLQLPRPRRLLANCRTGEYMETVEELKSLFYQYQDAEENWQEEVACL
ncbi:MAG: ABC transporter ATP-binding protein [Firmicutes bacterium]|nr:ABC transporter ATP-binding protein [Bacillota bacterium]